MSKYLFVGATMCAVVFALLAFPAYASHERGCGHTAPGIDCGVETYCGGGCRTNVYMEALSSVASNQSFSCSSCTLVCNSGFADCPGVAGAGCETAIASGSCTTAGGQAGTWSGSDCARTCTANPRPNVILAPGSVQADDQANSSVWINKTGSGHLFQLQGSGADRVVVTNSGQFVLGLSATDWTTFTQTIGAGQSLIYGGMTSASTGNAFLFERQGTPNLTLLRLTANGQLQLPNLASDPSSPLVGALYYNTASGAVRVYNGTAWAALGGTGGLATSGTVTSRTLPKFMIVAGVLTLTNSLLSETGSTLTVGTAVAPASITATGCFGPVFAGVTGTPVNGAQGGYTAVHATCATAYPAAGTTPAAHACSTAEILESVRCGTGTSPIFTQPGSAWIMNGPPGFLATANDCGGWTSSSGTSYGAIWSFGATGGSGSLTTCDSSIVISCCR